MRFLSTPEDFRLYSLPAGMQMEAAAPKAKIVIQGLELFARVS